MTQDSAFDDMIESSFMMKDNNESLYSVPT